MSFISKLIENIMLEHPPPHGSVLKWGDLKIFENLSCSEEQGPELSGCSLITHLLILA